MSILENKLQAIADAIREKEGSTGEIAAEDFADRILALLGEEVELYTVNLSVSPESAGTVTGGGLCSGGVKITIYADADEEDLSNFEGWSEDDLIVSTDHDYTFLVNGDRNLVANFSFFQIGRDWFEGNNLSGTNWRSVAYGGGKFVAIAGSSSGSNKAAYSTDGITWTAATLPSSADWYSVTYGGGKFVAVGHGYATAYSTNGTSWTSATMPGNSANWESVTYGNGKFVAIAYNSSRAAYSTNGTSWTSASASYANTKWKSITYGNDKFVAIAYDSNKITYSTNGSSWTETTLSKTANWNSITYGNGKFVAVGNNCVAVSSNGTSWSVYTLAFSGTSVTYGENKFMCVTAGSNAAYSKDGINWTATTLPSTANWLSVTYGNGKFVAVTYDSTKTAYSYSSAT